MRTTRDDISGGPYRDLHIYLIEGRVRVEDEKCLGKEFLGNWIEDKSSFLFFSLPARDRVLELVTKRTDLQLADEYYFSYEQWQGGGLEPLKIGPLLIVPPWKDGCEESGGIKILLDSGLVFGTGLHPTTKDCLRALCSLGKRFPMRRVLDIGTGTGILSLAAVSLGAEQVIAVDLNPLSVKTARGNVALNHMQDRVQIVEGRAEEIIGAPADLIIANIHYDVILSLLDHPEFLNKPCLILSGLMRTQARDVKPKIVQGGMELIREWDHDMTWFTMLFHRAGSIENR